MKTDQPKPTDEWTVQMVSEIANKSGFQELVEQHNAALAAEQEKYQRSQEKVREYFDLLSAERENVRELVEALRMLRDYQNGSPLPSYDKGWNEAMAMTDAILEKLEK